MEVTCATIETNAEGQPHVRLHGELDFQNAHLVRETLNSVNQETGAALVLDMSNLRYIDSSGLSALVSAARRAHLQGRILRLEGATPHVRHLLSASGFARFFHLVGADLIPSPAARVPSLPGLNQARRIWQHLAFTIPARTCLVKHIRARVSEMLESLCPEGTLLDAVNLAVGEAASNAVRHGCREDEAKKVRVQSATDGYTLVVEITDPGPGFDPDRIPSPELGELREGGMGIYFMRLTMDEVTYSFDGGTKVRLVKHLTVPDQELVAAA